MTAPLVNVQPCAFVDRRFVYASCWRTVLVGLQDKSIRSCEVCMKAEVNEPPCPKHRLLDARYTRELVDHLVSNCESRVAFIEGMADDVGRKEIQGFVVQDPRDQSIEFAHLRRPFQQMNGTALSGAVMKELLNGATQIVMRRQPSPVVTAAIVGYGAEIVVRPRSV